MWLLNRVLNRQFLRLIDPLHLEVALDSSTGTSKISQRNRQTSHESSLLNTLSALSQSCQSSLFYHFACIYYSKTRFSSKLHNSILPIAKFLRHSAAVNRVLRARRNKNSLNSCAVVMQLSQIPMSAPSLFATIAHQSSTYTGGELFQLLVAHIWPLKDHRNPNTSEFTRQRKKAAWSAPSISALMPSTPSNVELWKRVILSDSTACLISSTSLSESCTSVPGVGWFNK